MITTEDRKAQKSQTKPLTKLVCALGEPQKCIAILDFSTTPTTVSKLKNQKYGDSVVRDLINFKNEEKIISCSDDGSVSLWSLETGENLHYLKSHSAPVNSICLMNSKRTLLSGGRDNKIVVYDLDNIGIF